MFEAYKHGFDGSCAPTAAGLGRFNSQVGFSVGVFQWIPRSGGNGLKKSAVKIRIKGYVRDAEKVYAVARDLCVKLDAGWVPNKKSMTV